MGFSNLSRFGLCSMVGLISLKPFDSNNSGNIATGKSSDHETKHDTSYNSNITTNNTPGPEFRGGVAFRLHRLARQDTRGARESFTTQACTRPKHAILCLVEFCF